MSEIDRKALTRTYKESARLLDAPEVRDSEVAADLAVLGGLWLERLTEGGARLYPQSQGLAAGKRG